MFIRLTLVLGLVAAASAQTTEPDPDALFSAITTRSGRPTSSGCSRGARVRTRVDAEGTPALMAAALFADADMVERLLKRGADPESERRVGRDRVDVVGARCRQRFSASSPTAPTSTRE